MTIFAVMWSVFMSALAQLSSHDCDTSAQKKKSTHGRHAVLCVAGAPQGAPLSCQSRMDVQAGLHCKGLWGNPTNVTPTHTDTEKAFRHPASSFGCLKQRILEYLGINLNTGINININTHLQT